MLLMYFRFACSRDIFRCNQLLYGTGPFWKYSRSLSKELDLLLILNNTYTTHDETLKKSARMRQDAKDWLMEIAKYRTNLDIVKMKMVMY